MVATRGDIFRVNCIAPLGRFATFSMDTAPSEDETYVPTRWLQVIRDDGSLRGGTIGKARIPLRADT